MTKKKPNKATPADETVTNETGKAGDQIANVEPTSAADNSPADRPVVDDAAEPSEADSFEGAIETLIESSRTGHRITRRKTNRRVEVEETDETITEVLPPRTFSAPASNYPAPVG